jgi:addiction module HigA family antidote
MTSPHLRPARITSAGAVLRRELAARGWTQRDLAEVMGRPQQAISEIVRGSKRITAETALELAAALGTSAEVWLRLDAGHQLRVAEKRPERAAAGDAARRDPAARRSGGADEGRGRRGGWSYRRLRASYR